jgi:endonuclease/exonuclease/phosphatase family metal-dependent hydrolase
VKIATLNIDWASTYKSGNLIRKIEEHLSELKADFLVLTEAVNLELPNFEYKYFSKALPPNVEYDGVNYSIYLKGNKAYRSAIYSKFPRTRTLKVIDEHTCLAAEFKTPLGTIILYGTIIGTRFRKALYAEKELENFISDCNNLIQENNNLVVVGDLNTTFIQSERVYSISQKCTNQILNLSKELDLQICTAEIPANIDHIMVPSKWKVFPNSLGVFVERKVLSDHQGVCVNLDLS